MADERAPRLKPSRFRRLLAALPIEPGSWVGRQVSARGLATDPDPPAGTISLESVEKVLQVFSAGFTGETFAIRAARPKDRSPFTDGDTVFLPANVAEFSEAADNFRVMKLMLVHQLAQIRFGTFLVDGQFATFQDRPLADDLYQLVESARIESLLRGLYRGFARDLDFIQDDALKKRAAFPRNPPQSQVVEALVRWSLHGPFLGDVSAKVADLVHDSVEVLEETLSGQPQSMDALRVATYLYNRIERLGGKYLPVIPVHFRGAMRVELANAVLEEKRRRVIRRPDPSLKIEQAPADTSTIRSGPIEEFSFSPTKVVVREQIRAEGVGGQDGDEHAFALDLPAKRLIQDMELSTAEQEGAFVYDEWDFARAHYRNRWCALRERVVTPGPPDYVEKVVNKHRALVASIRRQFDALRPEYRRLRRQPDGEEIDLDSVVEAWADRAAGSTPKENLYVARHANRRDIGVAFLVDLSGSAGGWIGATRIVDIERESLVLICEALQMLNDRYAVYGFSSSTRKQCDLFLVKDFAESYGREVRLRIGGLETYSYTRMGPPIRHVTRRIDSLDARVKVLFILSDGKPNDFDGYTGRYAIEDTRQALLEARARAIRTYCLTIDTKARDYLPLLFGEGGYSIIDDVEKLPARLPDLYRRLTTR